jgi:putative ATP-dependent endonuclease of OLD family
VFKSVVASAEQASAGEPTIEPAVADAAVIGSGMGTDHAETDMTSTDALTANMTAAALRRCTRCIPLSLMPLDPVERRKVDRYLDVTKAALLFGGRVLLVEGIAEALLLPAIAKHHTLKDHPDQLRLFRSTVFVPIDGVDFSPYATLLLTSVNGARIADRVVILTDGDKGTGDSDDDDDEELPSHTAEDVSVGPTSEQVAAAVSVGDLAADAEEPPIPGEMRKAELMKLARSLGASEHLAAVTSIYSLEAELLEAGNAAILSKAYLTLHPRSKKKWDYAVALSGDERAKKIHEIFKKTRKGDFAQILARLIEDGGEFVVPDYIANAIKEVVVP